MAEKTGIAWTDATFNPWWGCTKVSAGCDSCYAETFAKRVGEKVWGPLAERRFFKDKHWNEPLKWNKAALASGKPFRVFCASMADVFEDRRDLDASRTRLFQLIEDTPALTWLLLTKRPENMIRLSPLRWEMAWPKNVWAMTTAEDQKAYDARVGHLSRVPASVRGISYEPAIGPIDFKFFRCVDGDCYELGERIHWVIAGGESGAHARAMELAWARDARDQSRESKVAFFMKQLGGRIDKKDKIEDLPDDLKIREWPTDG